MGGEHLMRVLRMVAEGKVSPEEAVGLLEALEPVGGSADRVLIAPRPPVSAASPVPPASPVPAAAAVSPLPPLTLLSAAAPAAPSRRVRIHLETAEGSEFNICHPLAAARHVSAVLPERARAALAEFGVDIEALFAHLDTDAPAGDLMAVEMSDGGELKVTVE